MKKLTLKWLNQNYACKEAVKEFEIYMGDTNLIPLLYEMINRNKLAWANWLIVRNMVYNQYVNYACYAARQVLEIYEKKYCTDSRLRLAIEAAEKCIKNLSKQNKAAAWDAARAARAAAWAEGAAEGAAMLKNILLHGITLL